MFDRTLFQSDMSVSKRTLSDIDMLEASEIGVAMGNSVPAVLAIANRVTTSNDEDGVALVLKELLARN